LPPFYKKLILKSMKKLLPLIIGIGLALYGFLIPSVQGQDLSNPTFSQFHYTPFLTNPGMIASSSDVQLMFNYRRKQVEAGQSFDTPMVSFLYPLTSKATGKHWGGVGLTVISDNAAGFLKTNGVMAGYAHRFSLGSGNSYLNLGLQAGYFQKRVDLGGQTTSSQFNGFGFDPTSGSGEMIDGATKSYATLGGGIFWGMDDEMGRQKAFLGVSYLNFTEPDIAFVDGMGANLPASFIATGGVKILQTDRFSIMPNARFISTAGNSQVNAGSWFNYHFLGAGEGFMREGTLGLGAWYNTNDALVMSLEFNQPSYLIAASYDIPTSSDISNIQRNGVFELTVALKLKKGRDKAPPAEEKDRDGDGVMDNVDACPDTPGSKEMLGCPDTDGDGIPDTYDNCPNEAGSRDLGGCPDGDGDGVPDKDDKCPAQIGPKSNQGCPTEEVTLTPLESNILETAKYVHFESGTAIIENTSYSNLDLVAEVMKGHPGDILSLNGHTDDIGEAEANLKLGQERAEAVKAYLSAKGIPTSSITTMSSGETNPIADNKTDEGRALNRRVEMKIRKKK
jgi:type IX secretion system PorP/SprF family membrane protein